MMPYTGKESRIILSFANAGGGDLFAHWLRDRLMKALDYYSDNAVYLDNIASRNARGGKVQPDLRDPAKGFDPTTGTTSDGSYVSIGAQNKNWFKLWQKALSQAKVLIQVQTKEYFESAACEQEMAKIHDELIKANNTLEVLAITFDNTLAAMAMGPQPPRTTPMQLAKVPGTTDPFSPLSKLKDSWVISDSAFEQVSDFMKARGCDGFTL
jgi:hypothetical protein